MSESGELGVLDFFAKELASLVAVAQKESYDNILDVLILSMDGRKALLGANPDSALNKKTEIELDILNAMYKYVESLRNNLAIE